MGKFQLHLLSFLFLLFDVLRGENVLIFSHIGSHFTIMSVLAEELCDRGYGVTIVAPDMCFRDRSVCYNAVPFNISGAELQSSLQDVHKTLYGDNSRATFLPQVARVVTEGLFQSSQRILQLLSEIKFHMAIVDPAIVEALVFVKKLNLRHIMLTCSRFDVHLARINDASIPLSVVPTGRQRNFLTHRMTFLERAVNLWHYFSQSSKIESNKRKNKLHRELHLPEYARVDTDDMLRNTSLWIITSDFNIEFPYSVLPNVKYVGSLTATRPSELPEDLKIFVDGSGDDGVIIFSLSTLFTGTDSNVINVFLKALQYLPQRVIVRGNGEWCENVQIKCKKWIPQNDLLGHPQTRAFITNGGLNGVQEAMFHGVPMVVIPLIGDQPDNAVRVEARGYGVALNPSTLTTKSAFDALKSVLKEERYRKKMKSVSEMLHFQHSQRSGRQLAAYWVEYAIKYAHNDILMPFKDLNYFQLHCLDVIAFIVFVIFLIIYGCQRMYRFSTLNRAVRKLARTLKLEKAKKKRP